MTNVYEWLDDVSIRKMVLPKIKIVFEKNHNDFKIVANVLQCIERTLDKLDKSQVHILYTLSLSLHPSISLICCYLLLQTNTSLETHTTMYCFEMKMQLFASIVCVLFDIDYR